MSKRERHSGNLTVGSGEERDVYKDIVRIAEQSRGNLKAGRIHKFITPNGSAYFILRGSEVPKNIGKILMDDVSRRTMKLCLGEPYDFDIREVGFWGELWWACNAVDPTYRVAARLGVLSFFLGLAALFPVVEITKYLWGLFGRLIYG